jgi:hypothetical protein
MTRIEKVSASVEARNVAFGARSKAPIFVMGCHRSGTNLLYDTLLSAGGFVIYRGYLPVHKILIPHFGSFQKRSNRERLLRVWLKSESFRRSGLPEGYVTEQVMNHCRSGGDFIRITMEEISRRQNVPRWAVYDPDAVLYMKQIKAEIPDALFVHIIRDGRDVALSLKRMGGFRPFPWTRRQLGLNETAVYWCWMVRHGRQNGNEMPADYLEMHYEQLVSDPRQALKKLAQFIDLDLDYDTIQRAALGRVAEPNSSFAVETESSPPIGRWMEKLNSEQIKGIESVAGDTLEEFEYELATSPSERDRRFQSHWLRTFYSVFLDTKLFLKTRTRLGRLANLEPLQARVAE